MHNIQNESDLTFVGTSLPGAIPSGVGVSFSPMDFTLMVSLEMLFLDLFEDFLDSLYPSSNSKDTV